MIIYECKPNGFGSNDHFNYFGDLGKVEKISTSKTGPVNGWLVNCHGLISHKLRFVFFGKENRIYFHTPDGIFDCSSEEVRIEQRKVMCFLFVKILVKEKMDINYKIYIPVLRFLSNDGMFPEEVEPLYEILNRIQDPSEHQRLAKLLSVGIAINEARP